MVESRERNWTRLTRFFDYPAAIRKVVYTINTVEGFHRQIRCVTKSKAGRPVPGILIRNGFAKTTLLDDTTHHRDVEDATSELVIDGATTSHFIR